MSLFDIFSSSGGKKAAANANDARITGMRTGEQRATGAINTGLDKATDLYTGAGKLYDTWAGTGRDANTMVGNALGLNGADGNAAAVSAFQTGPGYQFAVDSGLDAIDRRAASRGMLGSGNTNLDSVRFSQGLANQEYGNWISNLTGASNTGLNATNSQANIQTGLGDLNYGHYGTLASLAHGTEVAAGQSEAQRIADTQAAKQQASGNMWSAILGVGDLAAKFYGARAT